MGLSAPYLNFRLHLVFLLSWGSVLLIWISVSIQYFFHGAQCSLFKFPSPFSVSSFMGLYVHRNLKDCWGRGALDGYLDLQREREILLQISKITVTVLLHMYHCWAVQ